MEIAASGLVILVAVLHLWFLALEMFLWRKPIGLRTFRNSPEKAEVTALPAALGLALVLTTHPSS